MGANLSGIGQQPMSVGMSEGVYNRISDNKRTSETKSNKPAESDSDSSKSGKKQVIDNPILIHEQKTPEMTHRMRNLYLNHGIRKSEESFSGCRKNYAEYWEQTVSEERAVRDSIDRFLETEKQRGYAECEWEGSPVFQWQVRIHAEYNVWDTQELLPPLPQKDKAKRKVCTERLTEVTQCYQANPSRPLMCAKKANDFLNCFKHRMDSSGQ